MENLRETLLIFGTIAILAILIHGIWTIRKNAKGADKPKFEARDWQNKSDPSLDSGDDEYDAHGVGSVRVVTNPNPQNVASKSALQNQSSQNQSNEYADSEASEQHADEGQEHEQRSSDYFHTGEPTEPSISMDESANEVLGQSSNEDSNEDSNEVFNKETNKNKTPELDDDLSLDNTEMDFAALAEEHEHGAAEKLYGSVVTQPKPEFQRASKGHETSQRQQANNDNTNIPEPPPFLLKSQAANPLANPDANKIAEAVTLAKPETSAKGNGRVEPEFKLDAEQAPVEEAKPISLAAQARKLVSRRKKSVADSIRKEPQLQANKKLNEEQMRIDFNHEASAPASQPDADDQRMNVHDDTATAHSADTQSTANQAQAKETKTHSTASKAPAEEQATDVLVLNVRSPEGQDITGAALLPMLLTLGLKFGEQDIFHRHVNTNGKGPVLFSLANLFKPGVFDIDNIETFSTRGLSLFMMLPIEGDPQQVFNMMHNAARKLAEEFNCQILDGSRGVLSKQGLQKYSERIRDFERKRINR